MAIGFFESWLFFTEVLFSLCYSCIAVDLPPCHSAQISLALNCPSLLGVLTQSELQVRTEFTYITFPRESGLNNPSGTSPSAPSQFSYGADGQVPLHFKWTGLLTVKIYITLLDEEHEQSCRDSVIECHLACHCSALGQVCLQSNARLHLVPFPSDRPGWVVRAMPRSSLLCDLAGRT